MSKTLEYRDWIYGVLRGKLSDSLWHMAIVTLLCKDQTNEEILGMFRALLALSGGIVTTSDGIPRPIQSSGRHDNFLKI